MCFYKREETCWIQHVDNFTIATWIFVTKKFKIIEFSKFQILIYHQILFIIIRARLHNFFLQINMNFTCRIFPLSCFCEKKKNILAQFFSWAPQFVQSTYYVKMRGWLAREYINKRRIKYALNKGIIFPDGVSVEKWVEKLCETSWTVNWPNCNKRENRDKFLRFFNW